MRKITKTVSVGGVLIGGGNSIPIQSMTNTKTHDVEATLAQIEELRHAGCDIVRVTVPDEAAAKAFSQIKTRAEVPLVADIHFDYRLALMAIDGGADKIRINPGNTSHTKEIVDAARVRNIPIRIGVNSGSLDKKYSMVECAAQQIELLEYENIVVALKSSNVIKTIEANRLFSQKYDFPLHIGVTESNLIKSSMGIGTLLLEGIGDTMRVSLTDDPVQEVYAAKEILRAAGIETGGVEIISCPTCGRCNIDLIPLAKEIYAKTRHIQKPLKVAVMGCAVNGPGEARDADIGVAGGLGEALLFKNGEIIKKIKQDEIVNELLKEINNGDPEANL